MFDIIALAFICILTVIGWWKGLLKQLFGLAGIIAGSILAIRFYQPCSKLLTNFHPGIARAASFIAIFFICILIAQIIGFITGRFHTISKQGALSRIGGGLLGFLKGYVIIAVLIMALTVFISKDIGFLKNSSTARYIIPVVTLIKKVSQADIKAKYNEKIGVERPARSKQK